MMIEWIFQNGTMSQGGLKRILETHVSYITSWWCSYTKRIQIVPNPRKKKTLRLHVVARWATYHKRLCKRRSNVSHQLFWTDARLGSKVSTKWVIPRNVPLFKGYNLFTNHLWTFPGHSRTTNKSSTDAPLWSQLLPLSLKVDVNTKKWPRIQL